MDQAQATIRDALANVATELEQGHGLSQSVCVWSLFVQRANTVPCLSRRKSFGGFMKNCPTPICALSTGMPREGEGKMVIDALHAASSLSLLQSLHRLRMRWTSRNPCTGAVRTGARRCFPRRNPCTLPSAAGALARSLHINFEVRFRVDFVAFLDFKIAVPPPGQQRHPLGTRAHGAGLT